MKLAILVRTDLKMGKGKIASQVGHASVEATLNADSLTRDLWIKGGMKKIVLKVKDIKELQSCKEKADKNKLQNSFIKDAGKTQIKASITCLAIGPDKEEKIDLVTKNLKLL